VEAIDDAVERLVAVREALAERDAGEVVAWNDGARNARRRLLEAGLAGGEVHELRVAVPNRPGVVADVALALGRAGVNIVDMALYPAPDRSSGSIALWIAGEERAAEAERLIGALELAVVRA
jgi:prephenate dehydrogenase